MAEQHFSDKVALATGAAPDIGRARARQRGSPRPPSGCARMRHRSWRGLAEARLNMLVAGFSRGYLRPALAKTSDHGVVRTLVSCGGY